MEIKEERINDSMGVIHFPNGLVLKFYAWVGGGYECTNSVFVPNETKIIG